MLMSVVLGDFQWWPWKSERMVLLPRTDLYSAGQVLSTWPCSLHFRLKISAM